MKINNESSAYQFLSKIKSVLPAAARESKYNDLNQLMLNDPTFLKLMNTSSAAIAIFSYESMTYEYCSPNMEDLIGYSLEQLKGLSGAEFALNIFHPEHLNLLVQQTEEIKKFYYKYSQEQRVTDTRCTWTAQIKKGEGEYFWTLHQTMVLDVTPDGFPLRTIIFVSDISGIKTNDKVDFVFSVKDRNGLGFETVYMSSHSTNREFKLTEREVDVLNCIRKGMRNQEIADALFISKHTVITHRKNIVKKSGKANILQLLIE